MSSPAKTEVPHTPTPWEVGSGNDYYIRAEAYPSSFPHKFKGDDLGDYLALVGNRTDDFGEANAAFIVMACNSRADLVKALERIVDLCDAPPGYHSDLVRGQINEVAQAALSNSTVAREELKVNRG